MAEVGDGEALGVLDSLLSNARESAFRCAGRGVMVGINSDVSTDLYKARAEWRGARGMFSLLEIVGLKPCAELGSARVSRYAGDVVSFVDCCLSWRRVDEEARAP